jgi:hypothetical protein
MSPNVVIIGAPRSGTNILRDVLTSFDRVGTWPCDEINYIWRHGNVRFPSDEIPPERATPAVAHYIRGKFDALRKSLDLDVVVEKTCANSLRVPFVDRVIPDARYVYIYRDGIDATGSAKLRWTAELDLPYLARKVRYVPPTDLPYYGLRYFGNRIHRAFSPDKRLAFWGPKLADMEQILLAHTLNEVCALQWQRCVENAERAFGTMAAERVLRVRYEDFVRQPMENLRRVLEFVGVGASDEQLRAATRKVSGSSVGKGRQALGAEEVGRLDALVGSTLRRLGYD